MTSAKEYGHQVQECIGQIQSSVSPFQKRIERIGITPSSLAEAKTVLAQLRNIQKQLRQIKRYINQDMKAIRAKYGQRSSDAATFSSAFLTGLGKRKAAGKKRADAKRRLRAERNRKLTPYENLKIRIDDLLVQMDNAKLLTQNFIEQAKVDLESQ